MFNTLWNNLDSINTFYKSNKFTYKLIKEGDDFLYEEYINDKLIDGTVFNTLEMSILTHCSDTSRLYEELRSFLNEKNENITSKKLDKVLKKLVTKKTLYLDEKYNNYFSIIDISFTKKLLSYIISVMLSETKHLIPIREALHLLFRMTKRRQ